MDDHRSGPISAGTDKGLYLAMIPIGVALNLGIGTVVSALKLPLYIDAVGTIIVTLLLGLWAGVSTGVLSFLLGGILTNPVLPYFVGTQAFIAMFVYFVGQWGGYRRMWTRVLAGIGLGVGAGVVSAPVIASVFGGITGSGPSLVVAYLLASGEALFKSVVLSGLASEPVDKTIQTLLAIWLIKGVPRRMLLRFGSKLLEKNGLV